ncbi:biotin transporter BioY [Granulicella sp. dw_53]|uniref:biotin transporter BioY n=1 Tax=Granulicella sp. dw_53 TaxID=2719792 RepID=UPI001BD4DD2D|nr:biotin transporter BioY [Granulicella sp. dw_53]
MQSVLPNSLPIAQPSKALQNSLPARLALSVAATALIAICAHTSLPLPFTVVPLSLQTFAVILIGTLLGPVAGFCSMILYLAEGAAGLPVFTPYGPAGIVRLIGPTAGYLFSYPLAAACAGLFTRSLRPSSSNFTNGILGGIVATLPIFVLGATSMAYFAHLHTTTVWHVAIAPFIPGELIKITAAAGIFSATQRWRQARS